MKSIIKISVLLLIFTIFSCSNDDESPAIDTDGDGILDSIEIDNGTDKNDPCDPLQNQDYTGFDSSNTIWANANCDEDSILNGDEIANGTNPFFDDTQRANPELFETLSELNLFKGDMANLEPIETVYLYELQTELYTDYSKKARFVSVPKDESMVYDGQGFPIFPNNTILAKTFYYFNDESNESLGKQIIETRILIKKAGIWEIGNYIWNAAQTEAFRDEQGAITPVTWTDLSGLERTIDYKIPDYTACITCHQLSGARVPIGPKVRNMNIDVNGINQIQRFIDLGILTQAPDVTTISKFPVWNDDVNYNIKQRARAYLDVNCAHCHQTGGFFNETHFDTFDFRFELSFDESNIFSVKENIEIRTSLDPSITSAMPQIGTTIRHDEGYALLSEYVAGL